MCSICKAVASGFMTTITVVRPPTGFGALRALSIKWRRGRRSGWHQVRLSSLTLGEVRLESMAYQNEKAPGP